MGGRSYWLKAQTPGYKPKVDDLYYHRDWATGKDINTPALKNELAGVENIIKRSGPIGDNDYAIELLSHRGDKTYFQNRLQQRINKQRSWYMLPEDVEFIVSKEK